jgi:very-short-patch-repair endonuclease
MTKRKLYRTDIEGKMEDILTKLGIKYIFQFPIRGGFILDFAIFKGGDKYAIETDGPCHDGREKYDRFRDNVLKKLGWIVLRFKPNEITEENVISRFRR